MPPAGTLTSFSMSGRQVHVCWSDGEIDGLADRIQFAGAQQALVLEGKVRLKWRSGGQTAEVSAAVVFVHLATGKLEIGASAAATAAPLPPAPVTGESTLIPAQPVSAETFKFWLGTFR
jgi:hypothetical protein